MLSLWDSGRKSFDYRFIDREISGYFYIGGTAIYCHLYEGPYQQTYDMTNRDGTSVPAYDPNNPPPSPVSGSVSSIQDVLFLENRDRSYSDAVYEMRGIYNLNDLDFNLSQFGLFLQSDTLFIEFHYNDMMALIGRKLMPGDVLELPHRRDDTLDTNGPAINKFYVIEDASRPAGGYAPTWWPHMWRVKVSPMPASQEYQDILDQQATNPLGLNTGTTIGDLMSTMATELGIDDAVVAQAKVDVSRRYFETQQFWMVTPEASGTGDYPWVFTGDGIPPNGAVLLNAGTSFPQTPLDGDYYLRTDYRPAALFEFLSGAWRIQEQDFRQTDWSAAHRLLLSFINNDTVSVFPDYTAPEKTNLSQAIKPRADF